MKKVTYYIILTAMLLFTAISCTDVLEKASVNSFAQETVFSDLGVAKAFLGNCYDRIGSNSAQVLGGREDLLGACTDQLLCIHRPGDNRFVKGNLTPDNLGHFGNEGRFGTLHWAGLNRNIQNTNLFLANLKDVPAKTPSDIALVKQMKGEAFFIRAYDYAQLLRGYGGVILSDKPYALGADFLTITRSTIQQTLTFVLKDIDSCIANLPAVMEQGRANRAAAGALRSRILTFCASELMNGGYEAANTLVSFPAGSRTGLLTQAKAAAKLVMDGTYGTFTLTGTTADPPASMTPEVVKGYSDIFFAIFNQKGKWDSETIWAIQYPLTSGNVYRPNLWWGPCGYHNWGNNDPLEPAVRSFEMADGTPFQWDVYTPGNMNLRTATAAELAADPKRSPYNGREPRFYASVLFHGAPWQARPSDAAAFDPLNVVQTGHFYSAATGLKTADGIDSRSGLIEAWNGTKNGYYLKKGCDPGTVGQYFQNTNHWVEFRLSEVLLDYAEACIELGGADLQPGLNALNMVRNRAGLPDRVTAVQATARGYLRQERAIEFFAEDQRWYDIRRWMIAPTVIKDVFEMKIKQFDNGSFEWKYDLTAKPDARSFATKNYWLPLSRDEMTKSPQLQQNPNY